MKDLKKQAKQIMKIAEESGVQGNYFFITTFDRYNTQLDMLEKFKASMEEDGMLVKKEYVKGRKNVYSSPAVKEYNNTADCANRTVATLLKIIRTWNVEEKQDDVDPIMSIINGDDADE